MNFRAVAGACALATGLSMISATASTPPPAGGANQRPSVEGCIGETLFNGIWRLKVLSSQLQSNPDDSDSKNWAVALELRNAKNAQNSPGDSGFQDYPQLAFGDETLDMETTTAKVQYQKAIYYKSLPPGGVARTTLWFRLGDENAQKTPTKLLISIKPVEYGKKFGYTVPDPSFRVKLDCGAKT
ncbi:MAG: hypothetical protein NVSMB64_24020 [Candidatus Velthaea sp.]